jgi:hypothetical protein
MLALWELLFGGSVKNSKFISFSENSSLYSCELASLLKSKCGGTHCYFSFGKGSGTERVTQNSKIGDVCYTSTRKKEVPERRFVTKVPLEVPMN